MKKFLSVLLVFVLLASLVSVAFAAVNGATCPENDGGEMVKKMEIARDWYFMDSYTQEEDGPDGWGVYRHFVYGQDIVVKWVCTANPSHYDIITRYTDTYEDVQFQGN